MPSCRLGTRKKALVPLCRTVMAPVPSLLASSHRRFSSMMPFSGINIEDAHIIVAVSQPQAAGNLAGIDKFTCWSCAGVGRCKQHETAIGRATVETQQRLDANRNPPGAERDQAAPGTDLEIDRVCRGR